MESKLKKSKGGALELSIGTIVIIVIGMSMLILGLVLVRTIFVGSTESIGILNEKVQNEISTLFSDEGADIVVKLGEGQTAKIKAGSETFNVGIGARTPDGSNVGNRNRLQYKLTLEPPTGNNCATKIGLREAENLLVTSVNTFNSFDTFEGSKAFALVEINIPKGTNVCTQKVFIDVKDTQSAIEEAFGGNFFKIDILKEGFF